LHYWVAKSPWLAAEAEGRGAVLVAARPEDMRAVSVVKELEDTRAVLVVVMGALAIEAVLAASAEVGLAVSMEALSEEVILEADILEDSATMDMGGLVFL